MVTRARGTFFGALAIAAWSVYGVLLAAERETGPFLSMAIVFSFLATLYPAFKAANTDPVQVLRYE